jgi:diketogulonate reductase-like aldo/keto reductase
MKMAQDKMYRGGPRVTRKQFLTGASALVTAATLGPLGLPGRAQAASLITRPIPSSGEQLPIVGLGTARVYDVEASDPKIPTLKATVETFVREGGKIVDCSPTYGNAEAVVGRLVNEIGARNKLFYANKISTNGEAEGIAQVEASLKAWNTDKFDLLQVHNLKDFKTQIRTIRRLKDAGKARYVGITISNKRRYERFAKVMETEKLDFIQINYSLNQPESAARILPLAQDKGFAVLINRPFHLARTFRKVKGKQLPGWAADYGIKSWAQFFLKFVVSHPAVTASIPGTDKPQYMTDNLGAAQGVMPDAAGRAKMLAFWQTL